VEPSTKPIALVTGANKGIGKEVVRGLAARGYIVYLGARDADRGAKAKAEIDGPGLDIRVAQLDVTDSASISRVAGTLTEEVGRLDVLINNAGVSFERLPPSQCDVQALRNTYEVNVFGPVALTQALLPLLRVGQERVIVNLSSELGSLALLGYPDFQFAQVNAFAYNSSKTAINAFTVLLAKELRGEGFRVNSVNPGFTATDLNQFRGKGKVEEAAAVVLRYATLDASGPPGGYFTQGGSLSEIAASGA